VAPVVVQLGATVQQRSLWIVLPLLRRWSWTGPFLEVKTGQVKLSLVYGASRYCLNERYKGVIMLTVMSGSRISVPVARLDVLRGALSAVADHGSLYRWGRWAARLDPGSSLCGALTVLDVDVGCPLEHGQPGKNEEATVIRPSATFSRQQVEPEEQANGLPNRSIHLLLMF